METGQSRKVVLLSYLVVMFVITFGSLWGSEKTFPKPSQYVGAAIGYTTLAIGAEFVAPVATAFAILFGFYMLSRNVDAIQALSNIPKGTTGSNQTTQLNTTAPTSSTTEMD